MPSGSPSSEPSDVPLYQAAVDAAPVDRPSSRPLISKDCHTNNIAEVVRGLQVGWSGKPDEDQELLSWSLRRTVWHGRTDMVHYLIDREGAQLDSSTLVTVSKSQSNPLLQLLFDHGWDINQSPKGGLNDGQCLLQFVCGHESLVH